MLKKRQQPYASDPKALLYLIFDLRRSLEYFMPVTFLQEEDFKRVPSEQVVCNPSDQDSLKKDENSDMEIETLGQIHFQ